MDRAIEEFLTYLTIERALTEATIKAYEGDLRTFADHLAERSLSLDDVDRSVIRGFLAELAQRGNGTASRARRLATLKSFFNFLHDEGYRDDNPAASLRLPKARSKEPSFLTEDECRRLLDAVKQTATDRTRLRDVAIVSLLIGTGMRRSELIGLNVSDLDLRAGTIRVERKGQRRQTLPLSTWVEQAIEDYLEVRPKVETEALFVSEQRTRLSPSSLWWMLKKHFAAAGIDEEKACAKTLRHTFATTLLRNGVQLPAIRALMGHKSMSTTEIYLHVADPELREATETIAF